MSTTGKFSCPAPGSLRPTLALSSEVWQRLLVEVPVPDDCLAADEADEMRLQREGDGDHRVEQAGPDDRDHDEGEQKVRVGNTDIRTLRIALRGWAERQGTYPVRARYEGTAWLSPELHRLVRFEAQARTSNSVGILAFTIDESTELVRIGEN